MSNDTTSEIQGKLSKSLQQLQADADNVATAVNNITGLFHHARQERYQLILDARAILTQWCVFAPDVKKKDRLREILDELERLP